jgi:hypothetical protein
VSVRIEYLKADVPSRAGNETVLEVGPEMVTVPLSTSKTPALAVPAHDQDVRPGAMVRVSEVAKRTKTRWTAPSFSPERQNQTSQRWREQRRLPSVVNIEEGLDSPIRHTMNMR